MGYRNPIITIPFNHLVEEGDTCHVIIRNPKIVPGDEFAAMAKGDSADDTEKMSRVYEMISKLVVGWRVYDPTVPIKVNEHTGELIHDEETEPRLLPLPATPQTVAKLPQEIQLRLMQEVTGAVNPPANPAESTSTTS